MCNKSSIKTCKDFFFPPFWQKKFSADLFITSGREGREARKASGEEEERNNRARERESLLMYLYELNTFLFFLFPLVFAFASRN
jgi:hypothetical protein